MDAEAAKSGGGGGAGEPDYGGGDESEAAGLELGEDPGEGGLQVVYGGGNPPDLTREAGS